LGCCAYQKKRKRREGKEKSSILVPERGIAPTPGKPVQPGAFLFGVKARRRKRDPEKKSSRAGRPKKSAWAKFTFFFGKVACIWGGGLEEKESKGGCGGWAEKNPCQV